MYIDKLQMIESIIRNGHAETLKVIFQTTPKIIAESASNYIAASSYMELAKMIRFIINEDGTIVKVR